MSSKGEARATPRILIVEDEHLVAMDVEMQLTAFGYSIAGSADTGAEALRLVQTTQPDLILLDINLRGSIDGIAVASQLQQSSTRTPVVFLTAFGSEAALNRARATCPSGYLTKPYRPEDLLFAVHNALSGV